MKLQYVIVTTVLFVQPLCAATEAEREFDRLTQERDKALASAAEPINRRYQSALDALLKKATQANDLETALRIKKVLEQAADPKAKYVGIWKYLNATDKHESTFEMLADGVIQRSGKRLGKWTIQGNKFIMTYDTLPGNTDRMDLPVRNGKLEGKNTAGHIISLDRKTE